MTSNFKTLALSLAILAVTATQGVAASWKELSHKGLPVYELGSAATGRIRLVCDPDGGGAPDTASEHSQFYLIAILNDRPLLNESISFETDRGYTGKLKFKAGSALATSNRLEWNKLIKALSEAGQVTAKAGTQQFTLDIAKKIDLRCALRD